MICNSLFIYCSIYHTYNIHTYIVHIYALHNYAAHICKCEKWEIFKCKTFVLKNVRTNGVLIFVQNRCMTIF